MYPYRLGTSIPPSTRMMVRLLLQYVQLQTYNRLFPAGGCAPAIKRYTGTVYEMKRARVIRKETKVLISSRESFGEAKGRPPAIATLQESGGPEKTERDRPSL